jgi:hypothetical protein
MSAGAGDPAAAGGVGRGFTRLPAWLRPREREPRGRGDRWVVETTLLVLVGVLLLVATANDLARQGNVNTRLTADLATWRHFTRHHYRNLALDTQLLGPTSKHEVVCGNTSPGRPKSTTQVCLMIWGPIRNGRRPVRGGWYLPPHSEDVASARYGCFGSAAEGFCVR